MVSPEILISEQIWNTLRLPVTIVAITAPVIIVFLMIRYNRIIKRLKEVQLDNQKIIEKRTEVFSRLGPQLHDILSFFLYTGNWKKLAPTDLLELKRKLDKDITINAPLFSNDLMAMYKGFMQLCFISFSGWEHEEKIKSQYELRQEKSVGWDSEWIDYFDTNNVVEGVKLKESYDKLMQCFQEELNK